MNGFLFKRYCNEKERYDMMKFVSSERNVINIDRNNIRDNILIVIEFNGKKINKFQFPVRKIIKFQ